MEKSSAEINLEEKNQYFPNKDTNERGLILRDIRTTVGKITVYNPRMSCRDVNVYYGEKQAIQNVSMDIGCNEVIAMIGPSGCGKSTFIRCLTRMNDTIDGCCPSQGPGRHGLSKTKSFSQIHI